MLCSSVCDITLRVTGSPSRGSFSGNLKLTPDGRLIITPATVSNILRFYLESGWSGKLWRPPSETWAWHKDYKSESASIQDLDVILFGGVMDEGSRSKRYYPFYPIINFSYLISSDTAAVHTKTIHASFSREEGMEGRSLPQRELVYDVPLVGSFYIIYTSFEENELMTSFRSGMWSGVQWNNGETLAEFLCNKFIPAAFASYRTTTVWFEGIESELKNSFNEWGRNLILKIIRRMEG